MTHDEVVHEIQARARRRGVLSHYCHNSIRCEGDRGLPDVLLVGHYGVAFVEVKTPGDQLKPAQTTWKHALKAAGQLHEVMHEGDLAPGHAIDMLLAFVSTGEAAA